MRTIQLLAFAATLIPSGCGGSGDSGIEGSWGLETDSSCGLIARFDGNTYGTGFLCALEGGGYGMEGEQGTFSISGNQLRTTASHASCQTPTFKKVETVSWKREGDTLTISQPQGALIMKRVSSTESATGGVVRWGCWDGDDFTFGELSPVP